MPQQLDFNDQWVLVTGASAGIGEAFARALAARGAKLILVARRAERLQALAEQLATRVEVIAADLETPSGVEGLIDEVTRRHLSVTHLVNNAGFGAGGPFARQDGAQQASMIALNCASLVRLTHHFLPAMIAQNHGGIIQVASLAGFVPTPYMAVYGATKAFVLSFTTALAEEIRGHNVRMLAVCPGSVPTEFQARAGYKHVGNDGSPSVISAQEVARISLRAYDRGKHVVVPGAGNAVAAFAARFGSPGLNARAAALAMKRAGRHTIGE